MPAREGFGAHKLCVNEHIRFYLETKRSRSGHHLAFDDKPQFAEQDDPIVVKDVGE